MPSTVSPPETAVEEEKIAAPEGTVSPSNDVPHTEEPVVVATEATNNTPPPAVPPRTSEWNSVRVTLLLPLLLFAMMLHDASSKRRPLPPSRVSVTSALSARSVAPSQQIQGRVETETGAPLGGALLELSLLIDRRAHPLARAGSAADGTFAFERVPSGTYFLVISAPGRTRLVRSVRVQEQAVSLGSLRLVPGVTIAGTITRQAGRDAPAGPLENVVVRALPEGVAEGPPFAARTDAEGHFELDGLPPGTWRIELNARGFEPLVRRSIPGGMRELALAMRPFAVLDGSVLDPEGNAIANASVVIGGSGLWPPRELHTDRDGHFAAEEVPAGVYELRTRHDELVADPIAPISLEAGEHRNFRVRLYAGATLDGVVVDAASSRPIPNARIILTEDAVSTEPRALVANAQGAFSARGLLRRNHQVSARAPGFVPRTGFVVTPGTPTTVQLDREVVLTGRVVDGRGHPIAGAQLDVSAEDLDGRVIFLSSAAIDFREALFNAQNEGTRPLLPAGELGVMPGRVPRIPTAPPRPIATPDPTQPAPPENNPLGNNGAGAGFVTDAQGRFRIAEVPPGMVLIAAAHPSYVRTESQRRAVRAGEAVTVELVLQEGGTISGRLVDERGYPVPSHQIEARVETDPMPRRVFSQRDGTFVIPSVLGRVALVALVGGRVGARAEVDVTEATETRVQLALDGALRRIHGRIVDNRGFPVRGADLTLTGFERTFGSARTISTDDGSFETVVHAERGVTIEVRHPEYAPRTVHIANAAPEATITLEPGGTLAFSADIRACSTPELSVEVRTACGPLRRSLRLSSRTTFEHVCTGRITVVASAAGCVRSESSSNITANNTSEVSVTLSSGGGAEGEVLDAQGNPVAGAIVSLAQSTGDTATGSARTDRAGHFVLRELPEGDQQLVAVHTALGRTRAVPVRIVRGTSAPGLRLRFERELAGAVSEEGAPIFLADRNGHVTVIGVPPNGPAARAGVQVGDLLMGVQGQRINTTAEALARLRGPVGEEVSVELYRDGVFRTAHWLREHAR